MFSRPGETTPMHYAHFLSAVLSVIVFACALLSPIPGFCLREKASHMNADGSITLQGASKLKNFIVMTAHEDEKSLASETSGCMIFHKAIWKFEADGSMSFQPMEVGIAGLFPLHGHFEHKQDGIIFHAAARTELGPSATMDGIIHPSDSNYELTAIYTVSGNFGLLPILVSQQLTQFQGSVEQDDRRIEGFPVPSIFDVSLTGNADGVEIGPIEATLSLESTGQDAPYPFQINLFAKDPVSPGAMNWTLSPIQEPQAMVVAKNGVLTVETRSSRRGSLVWVAPETDRRLNGIPSLCSGSDIHLRLTLVGNRIMGHMEVTGASMTLTPETKHLEIQIKGTRQLEGPTPVKTKTTGSSLSRKLPFPVFDLDFPIFDLNIKGEIDNVPFSDLPATLIFNRAGKEDFSVVLAVDTDMRNGYLSWFAKGLGTANVSDSMISISFPEAAADHLIWHAGEMEHLVPEQARFTAHIDSQGCIKGTIEARGVVLQEKGSRPSVYHASFSGGWRGRRVDLLRKSQEKLDIRGRWWSVGSLDSFCNSLDIDVDDGRLHVALDGRRAGSVHGEWHGRYADFNLSGQTNSRVFGFLALAADRETLVGYLDMGDGEALVAERMQSDGESTESLALDGFDAKDIVELRYLGHELIQQGRLKKGAVVLAKALKLEETEAAKVIGNAALYESSLVQQVVILTDLIPACFQLRDYGQLVEYMSKAIELQWKLSPQGSASGVALQVMAELEGELWGKMDSLETIRTNLADFAGKVPEQPALASVLRANRGYLGQVKKAMDNDLLEIESLKGYLAWKQRPATDVLNDLLRIAKERSIWLGKAVDGFLQQGDELFAQHAGLLRDRNVLLDSIVGDQKSLEPRLLAEMARKEQRLLAALEHDPEISKAERVYFKGKLDVGSYLLSLARFMNAQAGHIELLQVEQQAASRSLQAAQAAATLGNYLESWKTRLSSDDIKIDMLHQAETFLKKQVSLLIGLNAKEDALVASEAARARAFADLLAARPQIRERLEQTTKKHSSQALPSPASAPPLTLEEIRELARRQGGTIIEYFLLEDGIGTWVLSQDGIMFAGIPVAIERLQHSVERISKLLENGLNRPGSSSCINEAKLLLRDLHKVLIEPLEEKGLLPKNAEDLVTIIPHGILFKLPFAALRDKDGCYFVEKHSLVHTTSLAVLKYTQEDLTRADGQQPPRLLAMVAPEPLPKGFKPVKELSKYFNYIERLYGRQSDHIVFEGKEATIENFRQQAGKADVIYFSTQAQADEVNPLNSLIALAKNTLSDGCLRANDIYGLNLRADLVILAACQTGRGVLTGDGVNGFSRSFTFAGASSLLMSLWLIPDRQTAITLYDFHEKWLGENWPKHQALRHAQLKRLKEYPEQPDLWAGLVLFGEPH